MTLYWIGETAAPQDGPIISGLSRVFDLSVHGALHENEEQLNGLNPEAVIVNLCKSSRDERKLEAVRRRYPRTPVVVRIPASESLAIPDAFAQGAVSCITEHTPLEAIVQSIRGAVEQTRGRDSAALARACPGWRKLLIGESPAIERVADKISLIAARRSTVLITGETGVGKEVVARAVHAASDRRSHPMVTVNCAALPETLLETELFGHAKGAFTGAVGQRIGRFEQANKGTLFLDEIGDMPVSAQTSLLRVLQEREFHRVGGLEPVRVDVRVVAATNVDLQRAVDEKTFRPDLLYRLQVFPIFVPPLRERLCDVELLAEHFIRKLSEEEGALPKRLSPGAVRRLESYSWPGNVRQLQHAVEMALVLSGDRMSLSADDFSLHEAQEEAGASDAGEPLQLPDAGVDFEELINEVQRGIIRMALERANGNKSQAASYLNMKRSTLVSKVKALAD